MTVDSLTTQANLAIGGSRARAYAPTQSPCTASARSPCRCCSATAPVRAGTASVIAINALIPVLQKMIDRNVVKDNDAEIALIKSPSQVLKEVKAAMENDDDEKLGDQLKEDFLHFLSTGIETIGKKKVPVEPNPGNVTGNNREEIGNDPSERMQNTPIQQRVAMNDSDEEKKIIYPSQFQPLMDEFENELFDNYAEHLVGLPRKMKRIVNSYMVSRCAAKEMKRSGVDKVFSEKLLKLIILFEQWPYRMAWLMVIVENLQREKSIRVDVEKEGSQHQSYSADENTIAIIKRLTGETAEEFDLSDCLELSLLDVYHTLVQGLIYSPERSFAELQRDGDPQVFEMMLAESTNDSATLKMKDIAIPGKADSKESLRPFAFNLQRHVLEKVQCYLDNCKLEAVEKNKDNVNMPEYSDNGVKVKKKKGKKKKGEMENKKDGLKMIGKYRKKPEFFNHGETT